MSTEYIGNGYSSAQPTGECALATECPLALCPLDAGCVTNACGTAGCAVNACGVDACAVAGCVVNACPLNGCVADGCVTNFTPLPGPIDESSSKS